VEKRALNAGNGGEGGGNVSEFEQGQIARCLSDRQTEILL